MRIVSRQPSKKPAPRMGALSILPVFYKLDGQRVIVVGGSEAAAWKAELLAASGASVIVYATADQMSDEIVQLAHGGVTNDSITLVEEDWRNVDLSDARLIVGDVDAGHVEAFVQKARKTRVPVNVIDKPHFCDFQFGSIVNRSPVVVGISTNGVAPILGQAVRRRIETLLPRTLGAWGKIAGEIRSNIMTRLQPGAQRRSFWDRFAEQAFANQPVEPAKILETIGRDAMSGGKVTLVGAGPGDADLLTVKAVRALQSADVILFDDLVSVEVLELARREAKRTLVGKRGGRESCRQEDINDMMLSLAKQGKHVVRLKSGDPTIFGRAGEEITALGAHGIPVTIIPGISAGIALASQLGISLTHRDAARSVRFVTGHSRKGELPDDLNWSDLADGVTTNIFYMSRRTGLSIVEKLIENGMPANTPCVAAQNLTRGDESIWQGTLAEYQGLAHKFSIDAPFIFAVGRALCIGVEEAQACDPLAKDKSAHIALYAG